MATKHGEFWAIALQHGWKVSFPPALEGITKDLREIILDHKGNVILQSPNHFVLLFPAQIVFDVKGGVLNEYVPYNFVEWLKVHFLDLRATVKFSIVHSFEWKFEKMRYYNIGFTAENQEPALWQDLPTTEEL